MESQTAEAPATAPLPAAPAGLSVWQRAIAVFTRPSSAWAGLETRAQWWFPLGIMCLLGAAFSVALHERAILPMITERWAELVDSGQMTAEQLDRMEAGMRGPGGIAFTVLQQIVVWPVIMLLVALGIWFGVGFVRGTKFRYRHALEVATWSSLVLIPAQILTGVLAWSKQTLQGVHVGLGILIPESDPPTKIQVALTTLLDALGPFAIWALAVAILGAAALSGDRPKSVAWVLAGLYLVLAVFMAALGAIFTPGA